MQRFEGAPTMADNKEQRDDHSLSDDEKTAKQLEAARKFMEKYKEALQALAKH
jgi:hypothetical protein